MTATNISPPASPSTGWNPPLVTFETWEWVHGCDVGARRFAANWGKQDADYYDKERMEDDRTAQVAAALTELAVAKFTNRYWSGTVWDAGEHAKYRDLPDVGRNIEVRRVRRGESAAVRRKQLGRGLILWVAQPIPPEFRQVEMWGWIDHDRAFEIGTVASYDKTGNTHLIHRSHLSLVLPG